MRIIDLPKIPEAIHRRLEQHSQEKGQQFADSIINSTSRGRGLWVFLLFPAWFMLLAVTASVVQVSLHLPLLVGIIVGVFVAMFWWENGFTRRHPFLSSIAALFVVPMLLIIASK